MSRSRRRPPVEISALQLWQLLRSDPELREMQHDQARHRGSLEASVRLPFVAILILLPGLVWHLFIGDPGLVLTTAAVATLICATPVVIAASTLSSARLVSGVQGAVGFAALFVIALGPIREHSWYLPLVLIGSAVLGSSWAGMPAHVRDWKAYWLNRIPDELLEPYRGDGPAEDEQPGDAS